MLIITLVATCQTNTNPIIVFQSNEILTDGTCKGMRSMYAQYTDRKVKYEDLVARLGNTYTAELKTGADNFTKLTKFKIVEGLTMPPIVQPLPAWILRTAIGKVDHVDGFYFSPEGIRHAFKK